MKILLSNIKVLARVRPEGYFEDYVSRGKIDGDYLEISREGQKEMEAKYGLGLGDRISKVAKPIAKVADVILRTKLEDCTNCAERQAFFNSLNK